MVRLCVFSFKNKNKKDLKKDKLPEDSSIYGLCLEASHRQFFVDINLTDIFEMDFWTNARVRDQTPDLLF